MLTDYVVNGDDTGQLETERRNTRGPARAAVAELTVGDGDVISYAADATDSSGGEGASQPAPDPMQVKFLAEGLDGLAAALESAMDGAAPRNLDPETLTPISAPLIGTDLDAGAGVPDILTDLTSSLRDELVKSADHRRGGCGRPVRRCSTTPSRTRWTGPTDWKASHPATSTVTVTCGWRRRRLHAVPSAAGPGAKPDPGVCTTDSPTGWDTITVSTDLTGTEKDGEATFETGLAGLEVRSDNEVDTTTSWTLPITLVLQRGVGPQVVVGADDAPRARGRRQPARRWHRRHRRLPARPPVRGRQLHLVPRRGPPPAPTGRSRPRSPSPPRPGPTTCSTSTTAS